MSHSHVTQTGQAGAVCYPRTTGRAEKARAKRNQQFGFWRGGGGDRCNALLAGPYRKAARSLINFLGSANKAPGRDLIRVRSGPWVNGRHRKVFDLLTDRHRDRRPARALPQKSFTATCRKGDADSRWSNSNVQLHEVHQ
jgi:hypothetical protein